MTVTRKKNHEDLARCLRNLNRASGHLLRDRSGLWLLSQPGTARPDIVSLIRALEEAALPDRRTLGRLLGTRDVIPLEPIRLARWQYDLKHLQRSRADLLDGIQSGAPQLSAYHGVDVDALLETYQEQLTRLSTLSVPPPDTLGCWHLDQQLHVLGSEHPDIAEVLAHQQQGVPVLPAARSHRRGATRRAAALVACARRQGAGTEGLDSALQPWARSHPRTHLVVALHAPDAGLVEVFSSIPPERWAPIERLVRRLAILAGPTLAGNLLACVGAWHDTRSALDDALRGFAALCAWADQGSPEPPPAPAGIARRLAALPDEPMRRARAFVRAHLEWMAGHLRAARPISRRAMHRFVRDHLPDGAEAAANALGELWRSAQPVPDAPKPHWLRNAAAIAMVHPDAQTPGLWQVAPRDASSIEAWLARLASVPATQIPGLLEALRQLKQRHGGDPSLLQEIPAELLAARQPAALLHRAVALGAGRVVGPLLRSQKKLSSFLDAAEAVQRSMPEFAVRTPWFVGLFSSDRGWLQGLIHVGATDPSDGGDVALFALGQAVAALDPPLEAALEAWGACSCALSSAAVAEQAAALGVEPDTLVAYLHYRRRQGHGETFSVGIQKDMDQHQRRRAQASWIQARLRSGEPAEDEAERLSLRLHRLQQDRAGSRRAGRRLRRSLERLRRESLEATLDEALRARLERVLGLRLPDRPLERPMRDALLLLQSSDTDFDLWKCLLSSAIDQTPPASLPPNRSWLSRAAASGVDTARWCAGLKTQIEVGESTLAIWTETDPLHVLRMGSYFGTCLSLGDDNAPSTLVNALDINKHVVYARSIETGTIVARKLIGATADGLLAGYETYLAAEVSKDALHPLFRELLTRFAGACGLTLSDSATPEVLHEGFWYDDGNEPWSASAVRSDDTFAAWERVLASPSAEALLALAPRSAHARGRLLLHHPGVLDTRATELHEIRDALTLLLWLGGDPWPHLQRDQERRVSDVFVILTRAASARPHQIKGLLRFSRRFSGLRWGDTTYARYAWLSAAMAWCETQTLFDVLLAVEEGYRQCATTEAYDGQPPWSSSRWPERVTQALELVWLREQDAATFRRAQRGALPDILERALVDMLCEARIPALAPLLRRRLASSAPGSSDQKTVALALGNQGLPEDGPRLLARLREAPSLSLQAAVLRCGHPKSTEAARRLWKLTDQARTASPSALPLLMEAAAADVRRQIRRQAARQEPSSITAADLERWDAVSQRARDLAAATGEDATCAALGELLPLAAGPQPRQLRQRILSLAAHGDTVAIRIAATRLALAAHDPWHQIYEGAMLGALWSDDDIASCPLDFRVEMAALSLANLFSSHDVPGWFWVYHRWTDGCTIDALTEAIAPWVQHIPRRYFSADLFEITIASMLHVLDHPELGDVASMTLAVWSACGSASTIVDLINESYQWLGDTPLVHELLAHLTPRLGSADVPELLGIYGLIRPTVGVLLHLHTVHPPTYTHSAVAAAIQDHFRGGLRAWAAALWEQQRDHPSFQP